MTRQQHATPREDKLRAGLKNLFSKSKKQVLQEPPRVDTQALLAQAQAVLEKLRNIDARNPEAFPLLNECTRCGRFRPGGAQRTPVAALPCDAAAAPDGAPNANAQCKRWRAPCRSSQTTRRRSGDSG